MEFATPERFREEPQVEIPKQVERGIKNLVEAISKARDAQKIVENRRLALMKTFLFHVKLENGLTIVSHDMSPQGRSLTLNIEVTDDQELTMTMITENIRKQILSFCQNSELDPRVRGSSPERDSSKVSLIISL